MAETPTHREPRSLGQLFQTPESPRSLSARLARRAQGVLFPLLNVGVPPGTPLADRKLYHLTNGLALIPAVSGLIRFAFSGLAGNWRLAAFDLLVVAVGALTLGLNALGRPFAARVVAWCSLQGTFLLALVLTRLDPTLVTMYWITALVPFFLFQQDRGLARLLALASIPAAYVAALALDGRVPLGPWAIDTALLGTPADYLLFRFPLILAVGFFLWREHQDMEDELRRERDRTEALLRNVLPEPVVERLKAGELVIADGVPSATILFADLVRFTELAARRPPDEVVRMLDAIFAAFDALAARQGLEKIKTIGDAWMAVGGVPQPDAAHARKMAGLALEMVEQVRRFAAETGHPIDLRVGLHTGPVVAGVIGRSKFCYDLWGDAVNTASRMESHGVPGRIQVSDELAGLLQDEYVLEERGVIEVKGKGPLKTWFLVGRR